MAFSEIDRNLLQRCLARQPHAWEDLVDRFLGLVVHVVNHTARSRSIGIGPQDLEDLSADVFAALLADDMAVLRRFRGQSSLATYLTVVARRIVVRDLLKRRIIPNASDTSEIDRYADAGPSAVDRISDRDLVERLLEELDGGEAEVVRLFHLDGKSYDEISRETGIPENSIGPTLSRARARMQRAGLKTTANS
ncbi:MAG: sigma-70 family RNA polymerase sigma factor [Pirellulaceae bacterium]|nr:sigma-70 family RNA polymerase sigma factor [Pirellulaceae bacterium]